MSDSGIVLIKFVKLALLEEDYGIPEVLLYFPILFFERGKFRPCHWGYIDGPRVVIRVVQSVTISILNRSKPWIPLFRFGCASLFLLCLVRTAFLGLSTSFGPFSLVIGIKSPLLCS